MIAIKKFFISSSNINWIEIIFVFTTLSLFLFHKILSLCNIYQNISFDYQNTITWEYTASKNILPYKEVFYPYGFLFYFKNQFAIVQIIYIFLISALFLITFIFIRNVFKERFLSYLLFLGFIIFVSMFNGFDTFARYDILVSLSLLFAFLFSTYGMVSNKIVFCTGIVLGLVFSVFNDQGIYSFFIFIVLVAIVPFLKLKLEYNFAKEYSMYAIQRTIFLGLGLCIGCIPLLLFLLKNNFLLDFINAILQLSFIALYAKTPYFPSLKTAENIFTYAVIIIVLFIFLHKIFFEKLKINKIFYFQLVLLLDLFLLLQKSIIRDISKQITFIVLLLAFTLLHEFKAYVSKKNISITQISVFFFLIISMLIYKSGFYRTNPGKTVNLTPWYKSCFSNKNARTSLQTTTFLHDHHEYNDILSQLNNQKDFNQKIFSFPGDPIFYVIFNQIPPYQFNAYDASSLDAQKRIITYIKKTMINYVIYNFDIPAIQDGVPNYARNSYELKYLLTNFTPYKQIDNFLILKRSKQADIFTNTPIQINQSFITYLTNIDLADIPKSEGIYKDKYVIHNQVIPLISIKDFNQQLKMHTITSLNKSIIFIPFKYKTFDKSSVLTIKTADNLRTSINFYRCEITKPCIIDLSQIPLFYNERLLSAVAIDMNTEGKIALINTPSILW